MAVAGTVAVAQSSQAAVAALKLSTATGDAAGATVVTVTGKDFQTAAGVDKVGKLYFSTSTCAAATSPTNTPTTVNVVSATKLTLTTPALANANAMKGTAWNLCVQDTAGANVVGTAKFTVYPAVYLNTNFINNNTTASGPIGGGTTVVISGENFTTKTSATIGGKALTGTKVVIGTGTTATGNSGDDTLTGVLPPGTAGTANLVVTTEAGGLTKTTPFTYLGTATPSPTFGLGADNTVVTVMGTGFSTKTWATAAPTASQSSIILTPAGATAITTGTTVASLSAALVCDKVQVVSDTEINCQLPDLSAAAAAGAYSVRVLDGGPTNVAAVTPINKSSIYTVAPF